VPAAQADWYEIEGLYRAAIERAPYLEGAFKNLGLLTLNNDGDKSEIVRLWTRFLELSPNDPEAGAIRAEVERLKAELP
jgi:tetratricopeptide (TPR) repeat protein